jgi:uncharacterized protein (UPF0147 family)
MANATAPYLGSKGWTIDIDPDDINYVVWDVSKDLTDRATTAASATLILNGMTASQGPTVQGSTVIAMLTAVANAQNPSATARVTCANGERFDRTIYFNLEDH